MHSIVLYSIVFRRSQLYCIVSGAPGGPKGRPAEPHRHHGKEKETHEGFSLWLSWLAVLLVGAYARRRRRRRRSRATWRPYSSQLADRDMYPRILAEECRLFLAGFLKKKKSVQQMIAEVDL